LVSTGIITFHVVTSNASIPVEGATVIVRRQETPQELLGVRVTDLSGQTEPLEVPTRSPALSQTPENTIRPWTGCDVLVEQPEYERVRLYGVQVFPGITTVQTVQLVPLQVYDPTYDQEETRTFTPQPLWEEQPYD
jgi:hypothetical protein